MIPEAEFKKISLQHGNHFSLFIYLFIFFGYMFIVQNDHALIAENASDLFCMFAIF